MIKSSAKLSIFMSGICLCATFAMPSIADTYRWVDDNGIVNFAERKPRGIPDERVSVVEGDNAGSAASNRRPSTTPLDTLAVPTAPTGSLPKLDDRQQQMMAELQQNEATRQEQVTKIRKDNCERSRRVLDNLSVNNRIRVRADDGGERVITEQERQQRITEAQQGIVANCDA